MKSHNNNAIITKVLKLSNGQIASFGNDGNIIFYNYKTKKIII